MPRTFATLLALATLSATAPLLSAQAYSAGPGTTDPSYTAPSYTEAQPPAPIERNFADDNGYPQPGPQGQGNYNQQGSQGNYNQQPPSNQQPPRNTTSEPMHGVWLVSAPDASVQTVAATPDHTELRVEHGRANVNIYHPSDHSEILVDLPGGQVSLLKDGLYTFNAETNTVRVLHGEAEVSVNNAKPVKVKEDHEFTFGTSGTGANGNQARAQEADPNQLRADLLQGNYGGGSGGYRHGDGYGEGFYGYPYPGYAYGWPYYGFYGPGWGYPYYAFGGPFGYGYPYGYGFGVGFGYYGGFRGGYGFRR